MCKKQGKSCETCPNKMNCPFSKEVEPTVQIGDKVEVAMTDTINAPETVNKLYFNNDRRRMLQRK